MTMRRTARTALVGAAGLVAASALAACGPSGEAPDNTAAGDWDAVLDEAQGQSVDWYMYGGDPRLNQVVQDVIAPRMAELGVTLKQRRVADTADAMSKALGEQQAGKRSGGSVDAIWVNGENFATGVQADLWRCGWPADLPNAALLDADDPTLQTDFGTPVDGCESPWQQASSALVYDSSALDAGDVASVTSLLDWAEAHPGRFTYPAPPDFTGSMAVRTILYDTIGGPQPLERPFDADAYERASGELWDRLNDVAPSLWRGGETYPQSEEEAEKLYADGEISAFFTYGPGVVGSQVADGVFPRSTREAVLDGGNIGNVSFLATPANANDSAGALVLANVLLEPGVQLALYRTAGIYPVVDLDAVADQDPDAARAIRSVRPGPGVLSLEQLTTDVQPELDSEYITRLEDDWRTQVLENR